MIKIIKISLSTIIIFFSVISSSMPSFENNTLTLGDKNSKITIKVFSSLTCPHCASFHNKIFDGLKKNYIDTNKVKFEHHSFPLDLAALNAEIMLRCLENKQKNFLMLSEIYKSQDQWAVGSDINKINRSLKKIGLNFNLDSLKIDKCIANEDIQDKILNERINAQKKYNISSTPTIIVNEKKYEGSHDYKSFKKMLDKLL